MNIIEELKWRGLDKQITNEERIINAQKESSGVYCGFDPTANSLHVGHLLPIITLERFNKKGFNPIALIGGGTGMIGDPSFKSEERVLQTPEQVQFNVDGISNQLKRLIPNVRFMNNNVWLGQMSLLEFLREVGKDFTLSYLLAKDSIARRIETGLSITEFSYTMLQAYDFYKLYTTANCKIQIGGSDQWGNITSGTDYIGSRIGRDKTQAAGLTLQLLTKKDGKKFGKTESGAVWLDSSKTSVYDFYQFWLNQDDDDCVNMLKFLTFLTNEEINELEEQAKADPRSRIMQRALAKEITLFVHQQKGLDEALKVTEALFSGQLDNLEGEEIAIAFNSLDTAIVEEGITLIDALVESKAASSKREAREFLSSGAITIKGIVYQDENLPITKEFTNDDVHIFIKRGKRKFFGIKFK